MTIIWREPIKYNYTNLGAWAHWVNYRAPRKEKIPPTIVVHPVVTVRSTWGGTPGPDNRVSLWDNDTHGFLQDKIQLTCWLVPLVPNYTGPIGNQKLSYDISTCLPAQTPGLIIQDEWTNLQVRPRLNFIGWCVTATDDPSGNRTNVTFTCASASWTDRLVSISPLDTTPGLLSLKLRVCAWSPALSLTTLNVWGNEYMELCLNPNLIPSIDQRVAVQNWCTPWFLNDVMAPGQWMSESVNSCIYNYSLNSARQGRIAPAAKMVINTTQIRNFNESPTVDILTWFSFEFAYTWMAAATNRFTIVKSWYYTYWFFWILHVSKATHSVRMYMGMPILDPNRSRIDLDLQPGDLVSPLMWSASIKSSMFIAHETSNRSGDTLSRLNAWEVIQVEYRFDTVVDSSVPWYNTAPTAAFVGKNGFLWTPGDTQTGLTARIKYNSDIQYRIASFS